MKESRKFKILNYVYKEWKLEGGNPKNWWKVKWINKFKDEYLNDICELHEYVKYETMYWESWYYLTPKWMGYVEDNKWLLNYFQRIITDYYKISSIFSWVILGILVPFLSWYFSLDKEKNIISKLYDNIIIDFQWASLDKVKEKFWTPYHSYIDNDNIETYNYNFKNWNISFSSNWKIRIVSINKNKIIIPDFHNRWESYKNIILWKSTFSDYCNNYDFNKIESSWWTLSSAKYTELEIDLWNFTQYKIIKLGTFYTDWNSEILNDENSTKDERKNKCLSLWNIKFDYIEIN